MNDTVFFTVTATSGTVLSYQWYKNGSAIPFAIFGTHMVLYAQTNDQAVYAVKVTNGGGSVMSSNATLTVLGPPVITTAPVSQTVTEGQNVTFAVTASGAAPLRYQWCFNDAPLLDATNSTLSLPNARANKAGSYAVKISNPFGVLTSDPATLAVVTTGQTTLAAVRDTYLSSVDRSFNYGAATSLVVNRNGSGVGDQRALLQFDLSSLPAGATITSATLQMQATANGGAFNINIYRVTQSWTEGSGTATAGAASWNQRKSGVNWTSSGGDFDPTVVATLNTGSVGQHSWNLTTLAQSWQTGATVNNGILIGSPDTGSSIITYSSREGATAPRLVIQYTVPATISTPPAILTQPQGQTVTAGQNASFNVIATGTGPLRYQWSRDGNPLNAATNATLVLNAAQSTDCGNYTVTVANDAGMVPSLAAMLTVTNPPSIMTVDAPSMGLTPAGFSFALSVPLGATYVVEATSNTRDWIPIATNIAVTSSIVFTDPDAVKTPTRFYRVMVR